MTTKPNTDRVFTYAELRSPTGRPKLRGKGDSALVRLIPSTMSGEKAWRLPSPCCAVITFVPHEVLVKVASGQWSGDFECGKPWSLPRGNARAGGCRAHYLLTCDADLDDEDTAPAVRVAWSGY